MPKESQSRSSLEDTFGLLFGKNSIINQLLIRKVLRELEMRKIQKGSNFIVDILESALKRRIDS